MANNELGPLGWFSAAGFVILSLLYVVDMQGIAQWPVSLPVTGALALLAAAGAILFWYGNDPTAAEEPTTTRTN
ncbi:hypothetical protein [Halorientalis halophila]|uniref:hypothetical protein n=1 Tax=Halorientalis halophila TaxID=3108499 RepID=UPI00300A3D8D